MALNLKRPNAEPVAASDAMAQTMPAPATSTEIAPVQQFDIVADKTAAIKKFSEAEIDAVASKMDVYSPDSIVTFGADVAAEIAKASDTVLNSMNMSQLNETSQLMTTLAKIMDKFDIQEIKEEDPSFFKKLFTNAKKQLDKLLEKYNTMGSEVEKIHIELCKYENEIKQSNKNLNAMFNANVDFFHQLELYIVAGEESEKVLNEAIAQKRAEYETTQNSEVMFELQTLEQASQLLSQRVQDLRTAENVAMQSIPMLKTMEFSNYNLIRKINSAFIITLPVFKQALAQAMMLKRQKLQAESMAELDKKTNEMLVKNAQNTVAVAKQTAALASGSSIKIETLETSWRTIVEGIEDTRRIQDEAAAKREEDKVRLAALKDDFKAKFGDIQKKS
jgi:uncharacterized protein YaaN involved in tellurite resistance